MDRLRSAAEDLLPILERWKMTYPPCSGADWDRVEALRQALAQPEQEPVAWISGGGMRELLESGRTEVFCVEDYETTGTTPLYTAPPSIEAAELRRLHEVNQMLVEALNGLIDANQSEGAAPGGFSLKGPTREHQQRVFDAWQKIGQALAKAKEQA